MPAGAAAGPEGRSAGAAGLLADRDCRLLGRAAGFLATAAFLGGAALAAEGATALLLAAALAAGAERTGARSGAGAGGGAGERSGGSSSWALW